MRRGLAISCWLGLAVFSAACYQGQPGEEGPAGLMSRLAELELRWEEADIQCWQDWYLSARTAQESFDLAADGCDFFISLGITRSDGDLPGGDLTRGLDILTIGPEGAQMLFLQPQVDWDLAGEVSCNAVVFSAGATDEGWSLRRFEAAGLTESKLSEEQIPLLRKPIARGALRVSNATGQTLAVRLVDRLLRLPAITADEADLVFDALPVQERLSLDRKMVSGEWEKVIEFWLNEEGDSLTVELP